ncbi:MAG TPA: hypothetical protein VLH08_22225 [Acidobacteriota bacterium]|nr:hypothetical protein [Acidobacteriota bacterium]
MSTRRELLKQSLTLVSTVVAVPIFPLIAWGEVCPTPSSTAGPYYKKGAPFRTMLRETNDQGIPLIVSGRITDAGGKSLKNATIEIWHTNPEGHYDLDGFLYRASIHANSDGQYSFETFLPGAYGGRAQHIHYKITAPSNQTLITQLYFESDPMFQGNPESNYHKDPIITDASLIRRVQGDNKSGLRVDFPICLR